MRNSFVIIILGRLLQVIISFLSIKIITNHLSPTQVAYYFLVLSIFNYFGLTLIGPVGQYVNRMIHEWQKKKVLTSRLFNHSLFVLLISLLAIPITYISFSFFEIFSEVNRTDLVTVIGVSIFFNTIVTTIVPTLNLINKRVSFVIFTVLWLSLSLILSVIFVKNFGDNVIYWFMGQAIAQAIVSLISILYMNKIINEKFKISLNVEFKKVSNFAFPLALSSILLWITTDGYRFILEKTHGVEFVGLFSVGFAISQRFSYAIESIAQQVFFPNFYNKITSPDKEIQKNAWKSMFYASLPFYVGTTLFTIVFATLLTKIFTGPEYQAASIYVAYGAIFNLFRKLTALFGMAAHAEMKTSILIVPYTAGAIFSSIILYIFGSGDNSPGVILILAGFSTFLAMFYKTWPLIRFKWCNKDAIAAITSSLKE